MLKEDFEDLGVEQKWIYRFRHIENNMVKLIKELHPGLRAGEIETEKVCSKMFARLFCNYSLFFQDQAMVVYLEKSLQNPAELNVEKSMEKSRTSETSIELCTCHPEHKVCNSDLLRFH